MPDPTATASASRRLPRRLGGWSAAAVVVGMVIGSGIFRVPSTAAEAAGSPWGMLGLWAIGGGVALAGALTIAELATMYPRAGGQYVFLRECYGPAIAFLFGWTYLLVTPAAWAAVALIFAAALGQFVALGDIGARLVAAGLIVALAGAQYRSVRLGAAIQNASTLAKVLAIAGLAMVLLLLGAREQGAFAGGGAAAADAVPAAAAGATSIGIALIGVLFAYDGWAASTALAGEVRSPSRTLPVALVGGMATVVAVYLLLNAAILYVLPLAEVAASPLVATDAATAVLGGGGATLIALLVMLSTFGSLNAIVMSDPRVFWAMSNDRLFFRALSDVHPRFLTPHRSIAFTAGVALLYVFIRTFEQLAEAYVVGVWPFLALLVAGVIVLRVRRPDVQRNYRTPGYPVTPLLFLVASAWLIGNALIEHTWSTLFSFGITLTGVPVYLYWRARR